MSIVLRPNGLSVLRLSLVLIAAAAPGSAQVTNSAQRASNGTITIFRPLSVTATANMSFGRLQPQGNGQPGSVILTSAPPTQRIATGVSTLPGGTETPAIRTLSGEPGKIYRITVPASAVSTQGGHLVNAFTLWTQNGGNVTSTRIGQLNASGTDVLRVGATINFPKGTKQNTYTVSVPISILYE